MAYDEVEIEDMTWNEKLKAYTYPCPCGDLFQITKEELRYGEDIARCPSCSLYIQVIYDPEDFQDDDDDQPEPEQQEESEAAEQNEPSGPPIHEITKGLQEVAVT